MCVGVWTEKKHPLMACNCSFGAMLGDEVAVKAFGADPEINEAKVLAARDMWILGKSRMAYFLVLLSVAAFGVLVYLQTDDGVLSGTNEAAIWSPLFVGLGIIAIVTAGEARTTARFDVHHVAAMVLVSSGLAILGSALYVCHVVYSTNDSVRVAGVVLLGAAGLVWLMAAAYSTRFFPDVPEYKSMKFREWLTWTVTRQRRHEESGEGCGFALYPIVALTVFMAAAAQIVIWVVDNGSVSSVLSNVDLSLKLIPLYFIMAVLEVSAAVDAVRIAANRRVQTAPLASMLAWVGMTTAIVGAIMLPIGKISAETSNAIVLAGWGIYAMVPLFEPLFLSNNTPGRWAGRPTRGLNGESLKLVGAGPLDPNRAI